MGCSALIEQKRRLQQHLPFTVLKPRVQALCAQGFEVATALTVYGIETANSSAQDLTISIVATALTVYGIETSYIVYNI